VIRHAYGLCATGCYTRQLKIQLAEYQDALSDGPDSDNGDEGGYAEGGANIVYNIVDDNQVEYKMEECVDLAHYTRGLEDEIQPLLTRARLAKQFRQQLVSDTKELQVRLVLSSIEITYDRGCLCSVICHALCISRFFSSFFRSSFWTTFEHFDVFRDPLGLHKHPG
jgi:hypothetical protein